MHSVKVYLKSGTPRRFRWLIFLTSSLLLINCLLLLESASRPLDMVLLNLGAGLLLLTIALIYWKSVKLFARTAALTLMLGGGVLAVTTFSYIDHPDYAFATWFYILGIALAISGLLEPILNRPSYLYVSPNRLRLRNSPFYTKEYSWAHVKEVSMGDEQLDIELKKGRCISLKAAQADNQHIRSHINAIMIKARRRHQSGDSAALS